MVESYVTPLLISVVLYSLFICAPIVGFSLFHYRSFRFSILMQKRYPNIVVLLNIIALLSLTLNTPMQSINVALWKYSSISYGGKCTSDIIATLVYSVLFPGFYFCALYRYWIIFFEFMVRYRSKKREWQRIISHSAGAPRNDWFLRNRATFGNPAWVIWFFVIPYVCCAIVLALGYILNLFGLLSWYTAATIGTTVFYVPVCAMIAVFLCMVFMAKFEDKFHVRTEMFMFSSIIVADIAISGVSDHLFMNSWYWGEQFYCFFENSVMVMLCLVTTVYPMQMALKDRHRRRSYQNILDESEMEDKFTLESILVRSDGCDLFMEYLNREFSQECLLALIEFNQFKERLMADRSFMVRLTDIVTDNVRENILNRMPSAHIELSPMTSDSRAGVGSMKRVQLSSPHPNWDDVLPQLHSLIEDNSSKHLKYSSELRSNLKLIQLHSDLIKSEIVYPLESKGDLESKYSICDYWDMAYALYSKYVSDKSTRKYSAICEISLQINIPHKMRCELDRLLSMGRHRKSENDCSNTDSADELQLFELFDGCISELMKLLRFSFWNFRRTTRFNEVFH